MQQHIVVTVVEALDRLLPLTSVDAGIFKVLVREMKMISHRESGQILGAHMIGSHVTDLIAEATLAVKTGCTTAELVDTIHAHPTLAEIMLETGLKAVDGHASQAASLPSLRARGRFV